MPHIRIGELDDEPNRTGPCAVTMAMTKRTGPCPVAMAQLAETQRNIMEKTLLDEYLGQSGDVPVVIANLENMLRDNDLTEDGLGAVMLLNARRALISLKNLQAVMDA